MSQSAKFRTFVGAATVAALFATSQAGAVAILDQSFDAVSAGGGSGFGVSSTQSVAQTFTVGIAGLRDRKDVTYTDGDARPAKINGNR